MHFSTLIVAAGLARTGFANYVLAEDYSGNSFFDKFDFFTGDDPTHGYVNYVDRGNAQSQGLINTNNGQPYIGVDFQRQASGRGRDSVRLTSKRSYNHMLVVIDVAHMPQGCGTWPAFWSFGPNWPNGGEIDIIEGVNNQNVNYMTLHTGAQCAIGDNSGASLWPTTQNCDAAVDGNVGCAFHATDGNSYGGGFNANGGGTYAMEWNSGGISIWWWPRNGNRPGDALSGNPNPGNWGQPTSRWAGAGCNWDGHFNNHNLIFDTTFCGDWAGAVFGNCAGNGQSCVDFVRTNPGAFQNAYWKINALKVYQNGGTATKKAKAPAKKPAPKKSNKVAVFPSPAEGSSEPSTVQFEASDDTTLTTPAQPSQPEGPLPHGPTPSLAPPEAGLNTTQPIDGSNTNAASGAEPVPARRRRHLAHHAQGKHARKL